ncbi:MAG: nucleotidyltransferase family protein [Anaerolineae bacterium]|nr:nucleotidyltransferase family protein [Anaerolineae bacterium]
MTPQIDLSQADIAAYCVQNQIRRLALFGSVLRDDFGPDSDVDMLVEFEAGAVVGLFDIARMERELSEFVGRKVDLRTPGDLSQYFRQQVLDSAEVQYERTG